MQTILIEVDDEVVGNAQRYTLPEGWRLMDKHQADITATTPDAFKGLSACGDVPAYRLAVKLFSIEGVQEVKMGPTRFIVNFDPQKIGLYMCRSITKALHETYIETVLILPDLLSTRNAIRGLRPPEEELSGDVSM